MPPAYAKYTVPIVIITLAMMLISSQFYAPLKIEFALNPIRSSFRHIVRATSLSDTEEYVEIENVIDKNKKIILSWTSFFSKRFNDKEYMSSCPDYNCTITNDKSLLTEAAAVVFHGRNFGWKSIPTLREPWQRFVFFLLESPHHTGIRNLNEIPNFFNWTMTYRYDSDVHMPYGYLDFYQKPMDPDFAMYNEQNLNPQYNLENVTRIVNGKSKSVVWFVSNCGTPSHRERYARKLKQFIDFDIYGTCGMRNCSRKMTQQCDQMIEDDYYFYFAAENSICRDYLTEKLWSRLPKWSVPIVLRRSLYENRIPMSGFIAVDDFSGPEEMAVELKRLMANHEDYLKYFDWRRCNTAIIKYQWRRDKKKAFCKLCHMLHDPSLPPKSYSDLSWWWHKQATCNSGSLIWK